MRFDADRRRRFGAGGTVTVISLGNSSVIPYVLRNKLKLAREQRCQAVILFRSVSATVYSPFSPKSILAELANSRSLGLAHPIEKDVDIFSRSKTLVRPK